MSDRPPRRDGPPQAREAQAPRERRENAAAPSLTDDNFPSLGGK